MGLIEAIILGIFQGLTEWLPISSTAHLRIVPSLAGWPDPGAGFTAVIQLGTTLAVMIYLWSDIKAAFMGWAKSLSGKDRDSHEAKMGWAVFIGTLPVVVLGVAFQHQIKSDAVRSLYVVAGSLIVGALIMLLAEQVGSRKRPINSAQPRDGLIIGIWQCLALIPGMSRSGSTISGGLFAGFDRATAARFSFLLSFPSVAGAGLYELFEARHELSTIGIGATGVATVVSFIVGYWSIAFLIKYLQKNSVIVFVVYRLALGAFLLFLLYNGTLTARSGDTKPQKPVAQTPAVRNA